MASAGCSHLGGGRCARCLTGWSAPRPRPPPPFPPRAAAPSCACSPRAAPVARRQRQRQDKQRLACSWARERVAAASRRRAGLSKRPPACRTMVGDLPSLEARYAVAASMRMLALRLSASLRALRTSRKSVLAPLRTHRRRRRWRAARHAGTASRQGLQSARDACVLSSGSTWQHVPEGLRDGSAARQPAHAARPVEPAGVRKQAPRGSRARARGGLACTIKASVRSTCPARRRSSHVVDARRHGQGQLHDGLGPGWQCRRLRLVLLRVAAAAQDLGAVQGQVLAVHDGRGAAHDQDAAALALRVAGTQGRKAAPSRLRASKGASQDADPANDTAPKMARDRARTCSDSRTSVPSFLAVSAMLRMLSSMSAAPATHAHQSHGSAVGTTRKRSFGATRHKRRSCRCSASLQQRRPPSARSTNGRTRAPAHLRCRRSRRRRAARR